MPATSAVLRIAPSGRRVVAVVRTAVVMLVSFSRVGRCLSRHIGVKFGPVGPDAAGGNRRQADVAHDLEHATRRGLAANPGSDAGGVVALVGEAWSVNPAA